MMTRRKAAALIGAMPFLAAPAAAESQRSSLTLDSVIGNWYLYKSRFLQADGRVADNVNGGISHSESQGYGMLLAVSVGDRASFERMWQWTKANLYIGEDWLAAWAWDPQGSPHVADPNNATDGDLLIAWALLRARIAWRDDAYLATARLITKAIREKLLVETHFGVALLPGAVGFAGYDQPDSPVVNLSYWIFPAIWDLGLIDPDFPSQELIATGLDLLERAAFGATGLPANWISVTEAGVVPAESFDVHFGYDAIRIPLYLAWYTNSRPDLLEPYRRAWLQGSEPSLAVIDLRSSQLLEAMRDPGYRSLADVVVCAPPGQTPVSYTTTDFQLTDYYPTTLHLLSRLALVERYPACFVTQL